MRIPHVATAMAFLQAEELAQSTDSKGGGGPTRWLVCRAWNRQLPVQEYIIPPRPTSWRCRSSSGRGTWRDPDNSGGEIDQARARAWPPVPEYISQLEGLPGVLKLSDSDSRKAWSLMQLAVRCRSPGNLVEIHWYICIPKIRCLNSIRSRPPWSGVRSTCMWVCVGVWVMCVFVGGGGRACYHGGSNRLLFGLFC